MHYQFSIPDSTKMTLSLQPLSLRTFCMLLAVIAAPQLANAQQQVRYPQSLENGGKQFAAYVNDINGTPTWIVDTDSLDFTLGTPLTLSSEFGVEIAADAHSGKILREYSNMGHGGHLNWPRLAQDEKIDGATSHAVRPTNDELAVAQTECSAGGGASYYSIGGTITLNYYSSPDISSHALHRTEGAGFPYAKFSVSGGSLTGSCEDHADANGNYSVGLPGSGTYTVTFYMESDSVSVGVWEIATGEPSRACQQQTSFTMHVDAHERLDYDWGWGLSGDGGTSSFVLNGIYNILAMRNYFSNTHGVNTSKVTGLSVFTANSPRARIDADGGVISIGGASAMSNEVIMHEYVHLIVDTLVTSGTGNELQPVREAAADYFAADATGDALVGGPVPPTGKDAGLDRASGDLTASLRNLNNSCKADWGCGTDVYQKSLVLSGAVWSLRDPAKLGAMRATELFYRALSMKPNPPTFETIASYMIDEANSVSKEDSIIKSEFVSRYVLGPPPATDLFATCSTSGTIVLTWSDEASNEAGYEVERKTGEGGLQLVARLAANTETYFDTGASCGSGSDPVYSYYVTVVSTFGSANTDTRRTVSEPTSYPATSSQSQLRASKLKSPQKPNDEESLTFETGLRSVYPNPFNPVTTIAYALKEEDHVSLAVYNVLGRKVAVLVDGVRAAGEHAVAFDATRLPSGAYFVSMETSAYRRNQTMMLAK